MTNADGIVITPTRDEHVLGFTQCVDAVARERRFIGFVEGPSLEQSQEFVRNLFESGGIQFVALDRNGRVVGWCDISRPRLEGFRHCGHLGMGLLREMRGRGVGRQLAVAAIRAAQDEGIERIELEVFASNTAAIALYERLGFVREGVKRQARKIDGYYEDNLLMALVPVQRSAERDTPH